MPGGISSDGCEIIINGTGRYVQHSPIADCGTTGRKLAVDFYGGACRIGGGSPWTKDGSKADLTLNLYARKLARQYAEEYGCDVYTSLACCIGKQGSRYFRLRRCRQCLVRGHTDYRPDRAAPGIQARHAHLCLYVPLGTVRGISER